MGAIHTVVVPVIFHLKGNVYTIDFSSKKAKQVLTFLEYQEATFCGNSCHIEPIDAIIRGIGS